jgi:hypothetical protein
MILRDGPSALLRMRGMARRKAQTDGIRNPCGSRRAPLGAPHAHLLGALPRFALLERLLGALERMSFAASPQTVRHRASLSVAGVSLTHHLVRKVLQLFGDGAAGRSAGSQRGLVVVPGGAPMPPGWFAATKPAGAAPRPAITTPRDGAPQVVVREVFDFSRDEGRLLL